MRLFCITLLKNEVDIVEEMLRSASVWAERIFVYDNGSTDGTWELVNKLALELPPVTPFKQDPKTFQIGMRSEVFAHYRHLSKPGDWWCLLDADEFYPEDPRKFLAAVPPEYQAVWAAFIQFMLTDKDVALYERQPELFDASIPVQMRVRYYINNWSEGRFFKYDEALEWPANKGLPYSGAVYSKRIPMKHFKHRSPQQLQARIDVRKASIERGTTTFNHERDRPANWRDRIRPVEEMNYDTHDGVYVMREELMPPLPLSSRLPPVLVNRFRNLKRLFKKK